MDWLREHNKEILIVTLSMFILGGVVFTGMMGFSQSPFSAALIVNGEKIPYKNFDVALQRRVREEEGALTDEKLASYKEAVIQDLVRQAAFLQEADRYGLKVTDAELAANIQHIPAFQSNGQFNQSAYLAYVTQSLRETPSAFEEEFRDKLKENKLLMFLGSSAKISRAEANARFSRMTPEEKKKIGTDPEKIRQTIAREEGQAVLQAWMAKINTDLKVESRLNRWENHPSM